MDRINLSFIIVLLISFSSQAGIADRFYKTIPIENAHYPSGMAYQRELDPHSIKAFVWNIKKTQEPAWKKEFEEFGKNKDLILLQEAYQNDLYTTTTESFSGIRWDLGASFLYVRDGDTPTGTAIGSTAQPSEIIIKHTTDTEPLVGTPKAMTFAKYPVAENDQDLLVISVHGINITTFASFKRHMKQAEEEIIKHDGPIFFAGDFNTRTKKRTTHLFELMEKLKLQAINFKNAEHRMVWKFTKNYLDHGFVRGLQVKDAEVLKNSKGSDHLPMIVELSVTR